MEKIGIIAGSGFLPPEIARIHSSGGGEVFIAALEEQADPALFQNFNYRVFSIGKVGAIIKFFKNNAVQEIIFAGKIQRPDIKSLKVDLVGSALLAKILLQRFLGDDAVLRLIADFLESKGLKVISAQDILARAPLVNLNTKCSASEQDIIDIELGRRVIESLGDLDVGQAAIVQDGYVLGIEAAEGTDNLIKRCASLRKKPSGGVLVKMMKRGQDRRLDIPTVGLVTFDSIADFGYNGIAIEPRGVIVLTPKEVVSTANKRGLFIHNI